jgi:integrase
MSPKKAGKRVLTDMACRNAKPQSCRYDLPDGDGLFLRVASSGAKVWCIRYVIDGKQWRFQIGKYPKMSLADARQRQAALEDEIAAGYDPREKKRLEKQEPTFGMLLEKFWEKELKDKPTAQEQRRLIEKDALPILKNRKVKSITRRDIVEIVDDVRDRAPVTGNRLQTVLIRMFNFASEKGEIRTSPIAGLKRKKEESRARVLTDDEIRLLWGALDIERQHLDIYVLTKLALQTILLTGQRPGEVCSMRWDQIDNGLWIISAEDRKNQEENIIPVTEMFSNVLQAARVYSISEYVFQSPSDPKRPLTVGALANAIRRNRAEIGVKDPFTPHDLRRTLRTRLAALGVTDIVAERVLGHKLQGVMAIYNRYDYVTEKKQALERWETSLKQIIGETMKSNVIPLR